ncbi:hypothetical protein AB1Y20_022573 [Prymnesium parvum]|uniref:Guanine nucleotide-binding protein subunit beta-like protein n=1 Tax=Prymnesium parvum TaxID=97485 RepID=A0AB34JGP4_PRYPA
MAAPPPPAGVLRGHAAAVTAARFTAADGAGEPLLASAGADGELRLWSLRTRRTLAAAAAHSAPVLSLLPLADGRLLTHGRDGAVRVWDGAAALALVGELAVRSYSFCQCAGSPALLRGWPPASPPSPPAATPATPAEPAGWSSALLASPSEDAQEVLLWDLRQKAAARTLRPSSAGGEGLAGRRVGMCMCLRFVQRQPAEGGGGAQPVELLSGWEDGTLKLFDLRADLPVSSSKLHTEPLLCVDAAATYAVTGSADCAVSVVELANSNVAEGILGSICQLSIPVTNEAQGSGGVSSLSLRPDGKLLAAGGWDKRVRVWQTRKWKPLAVLRQHNGTVNAVDFSSCSRWLASASNDHTIALWSLYPP